jgi:hypothetical protein
LRPDSSRSLKSVRHSSQFPTVIDGCAEVWMLVPRAMPKLSEDSQHFSEKRPAIIGKA